MAQNHRTVELPLEITGLIIDQLVYAKENDSLRNFAVTSRDFVVRCQRELFRTIDLGDRCISGEEYYRRFLRIISQRPNLCAYIEQLRLVDTYVWDRNRDWSWLVEEETIGDVLDLLPNLRDFSLKFNTCLPVWAAINPSTRHALIKLAERSTLRSYSLTHIHGFPPSLLVPLLGVNHLEFNDLRCLDLNSTTSFDFIVALGSIPISSLKSLVLWSPFYLTVQLLHRVLSTLAITAIESLIITAVNEKDAVLVTALWDLIKWSAPTLTYFEWRPFSHPRNALLHPPEPIHLGVLQNLTTLRFVVNFHSQDNPVFSELVALLEQIASGTHFKELVMECMFLQVVELVARGSDWSALDLTLARPELCGLTTVAFIPRSHHRMSKVSAKMILLEQLPIARSRGVKTVCLD